MPTDMNGLVDALGNAAQQAAMKGAGASDGGQAKDYGAAALAFTQALMLIVAPKPQPPQNPQQHGPQPPQAP